MTYLEMSSNPTNAIKKIPPGVFWPFTFDPSGARGHRPSIRHPGGDGFAGRLLSKAQGDGQADLPCREQSAAVFRPCRQKNYISVITTTHVSLIALQKNRWPHPYV